MKVIRARARDDASRSFRLAAMAEEAKRKGISVDQLRREEFNLVLACRGCRSIIPVGFGDFYSAPRLLVSFRHLPIRQPGLFDW